MHPQLQTIIAEFEAARARFTRLADATPDDRWASRSDPYRWSVAECIAHLNLSSRAMQPKLESATAAARALGVPAPARYRRSFIGAALSMIIGPVFRVRGVPIGRVRTSAPFVPTADGSRAEVTAEFRRHLDAHESVLKSSDGLALDRIQIESPFIPGTRYDAFSAWQVLARHIHRHLDQAEHVWAAR